MAGDRPGGFVQSGACRPGPRYSVSKGSTPARSSDEARELLRGMDVSTPIGLRDRAIIAAMTYTFVRVGAVVALKVEGYYPQEKRWWPRLREKNGKLNEMPCRHNLEEYLDAHIAAAGIGRDRKATMMLALTKWSGSGFDGCFAVYRMT